ncbi:MAG: NUDIX hydrolase [Nocardioides sp.]|nr:NUDIX hydrolase [Nocardioides sp.]
MVYTSDYPIISLTVDVALVSATGRVLLVERGQDPYAGLLALPGGFVDVDEDLETSARRELREETGLRVEAPLEQLGAYGRPDRDPRGRTVSVVFWAQLDDEPDAVGGDDAAAAHWFALTGADGVLADPDRLAFDHAEVLRAVASRTGA